MPQSLSSVLIHLVFSTKNREPWIRGPVEGKLHAYLGGILREINCPSLTVGGTADHVHILFVLARTMAISNVVEEVKTGSSKWIK
ncbi:MAG TPA: transposase, partial [Pirellulales bacterium]|nr:transposase [Pirellulales bacterium]